jgi:alkaline phosphatase
MWSFMDHPHATPARTRAHKAHRTHHEAEFMHAHTWSAGGNASLRPDVAPGSGSGKEKSELPAPNASGKASSV